MAFRDRLKTALEYELPDRVEYLKGWRKIRRLRWQGPRHRPVALMLHHTAGAATESTNPKAAGNQKGANAGIVNFIQNHYRVPAANFTLDRDGTVYVHSAYPIWHAGAGTFSGKKPWGKWLGVKPGRGNDYMMGVEIVSRGRRKDFTSAQIQSLERLQEAVGRAAGWPKNKRRAKVRRPRHSDWTRRKIDILYTHKEIDRWMGSR